MCSLFVGNAVPGRLSCLQLLFDFKKFDLFIGNDLVCYRLLWSNSKRSYICFVYSAVYNVCFLFLHINTRRSCWKSWLNVM